MSQHGVQVLDTDDTASTSDGSDLEDQVTQQQSQGVSLTHVLPWYQLSNHHTNKCAALVPAW